MQQRNAQSYSSVISDNQQRRNNSRQSSNIISASSSHINIPAAVFSRSPNKDRDFLKPNQYNSVISMQSRRNQPLNQIPFGINTPNRYARNSPSPLGNRQASNISTKKSRPSLGQGVPTKQSSLFNPIIQNSGTPIQHLKTNASSQYLSEKNLIKQCQNHNGKTAKYYVESEQQALYYCEKCAISLASQGFKVSKFSFNENQALSDSFQNQERRRQHQKQQQIQARNKSRRHQIGQFLFNLEQASIQMKNKNACFRKIIEQTRKFHQQYLDQVERYYQHFFDLLNQHKNAVVSSLKYDFQNKVLPIQQFLSKNLQNNISKASSMKNDIQLSLDTVIPQAQSTQYEAVINLYKEELSVFKKIGSISFDQLCKHQLVQNRIKLLGVNFQDPSELIAIMHEQLDNCVSLESQNRSLSSNLSGKIDFGKALFSGQSLHKKEHLHTSNSRYEYVIEQVEQEYNPQTAKTSAIYQISNQDSQLTESQSQLAKNMRPSKFCKFGKQFQSKIDGIAVGQSRVIEQGQQKDRDKYKGQQEKQKEMKSQQENNLKQNYQNSSFETNPTLKQLGHLFCSFESYQ